MKDPTKDHARVSPEGKRIGATTVRIAEVEIQRLAAEGEPDERCKSCAFRLGTVPNGCLQTQADVVKAVVEGVPFMCHAPPPEQREVGKVCWGWFAAARVARRMEKATGKKLPPAPYDFSPPDPKPKRASR